MLFVPMYADSASTTVAMQIIQIRDYPGALLISRTPSLPRRVSNRSRSAVAEVDADDLPEVYDFLVSAEVVEGPFGFR